MNIKSMKWMYRYINFIGCLILLLVFSFPVQASGNNWYVRPGVEPGTYGGENGTDYNNAWNGFENIEWTVTGVQPGDTLYVCGTHYADTLEIKGSGINSVEGIQKITIDGACLDELGNTYNDSGVIVGAKGVNEEINWVSIGDNKYATDEGSYDSFPAEKARAPGWVILVPAGQELPVNQSNVHFTKEADSIEDGAVWWETAPDSRQYDPNRPGRMIMYISSDQNPSSVYSRIIIPKKYAGIMADAKEYVDINHITLMYQTTTSVRITSSNNINVYDVTVSYFGGALSSINPDQYPRAGNGIEFDGDGSHDNSVKDCMVYQGFDVGLDMELYGQEREVAHDITFENNIVDRCGGGISINTHINDTIDALGCSDISGELKCLEIYNVTVKNNIFSNIGLGWSGSEKSSPHGSAIQIQEVYDEINETHSNVYDITIEDNIIEYYAWVGILMREGHATIRRNVIRYGTAEYGNDGWTKPAGIVLHGNDYVRGDSEYEATALVSNNVIYNNAGHGIFLINNTPYPDEGKIEIYNNTLYNNGTPEYPNFYSTTSSGTILMNNIIYSNNSLCFSAGNFGDGKTISDFNIFNRASGTGDVWKQWGAITYNGTEFSAYKEDSGNDTNSYAGDPLFVDINLNRFDLQSTSDGIDNGTYVGLELDFCGNFIPVGSGQNIGAFEGECTAYYLNFGLCTDNDGDGYFIEGGPCGEVDCNDNDAYINPAADEICNVVDDNCDGNIDEGDVCFSDITSTPESKDFGSVTVGSVSSSQIFTISNAGTAALEIGGAYLTGTNPFQFSIQSENCQGRTIAPSGTCTIEALYAPTNTGTMNAEIGIDSNDPDTDHLYIGLTGTGF